MINYLLGIITGIMLSTLIISILAYFRRVIEHKTTIIEKQIDRIGPKPKGFLIEFDEIEEARQNIIQKNQASGRETKLSELQ